MAARYVDTANIVAQGQSFYTGLLPGSYEKGGGGGGSNVMGKGSGGTAGVSADRTASEAGVASIKNYKPGGSIFGKATPSDTDRIVGAIKKGPDDSLGGAGMGAFFPGTPPGGGPVTPTAPTGGMGNPAKNQGRVIAGEAGTAVGLGVDKWVTSTTGNPILGKIAGGVVGGATEHGLGRAGEKIEEKYGKKSGLLGPTGNPIEELPQRTAQPTGGGTAPPLPDPGDVIKKATMGQWEGAVQRVASTRSHTRQPGVQQSIPQQAIPSLSVSGVASTRSHARQPGVQQSATHKAFLFPNMANSTNRTLNF